MTEEVPDIIDGFTHTEYLVVFIAIIFGYVGAEYFQGWGWMIRNRKEINIYWQHIAWTIFAFVYPKLVGNLAPDSFYYR